VRLLEAIQETGLINAAAPAVLAVIGWDAGDVCGSNAGSQDLVRPQIRRLIVGRDHNSTHKPYTIPRSASCRRLAAAAWLRMVGLLILDNPFCRIQYIVGCVVRLNLRP
jgi:hypothetical protein